jgi:hypothetical protein
MPDRLLAGRLGFLGKRVTVALMEMMCALGVALPPKGFANQTTIALSIAQVMPSSGLLLPIQAACPAISF